MKCSQMQEKCKATIKLNQTRTILKSVNMTESNEIHAARTTLQLTSLVNQVQI